MDAHQIILLQQPAGERSRIYVPTLPLDLLLERFRAPTFVKIDVEGAEVAVLKGCETILRTARPVIYYEASDETSASCAALIERFGYSVRKGAEMNWLAIPTS